MEVRGTLSREGAYGTWYELGEYRALGDGDPEFKVDGDIMCLTLVDLKYIVAELERMDKKARPFRNSWDA